jgi:hypothetical protein
MPASLFGGFKPGLDGPSLTCDLGPVVKTKNKAISSRSASERRTSKV